MILNPCYRDLSGFYRKTEVAFLGEQIDFTLMTPKQLDQALIESIELYNKLYPPPPKKSKFMTKIAKTGLVVGLAAFTGGTILAAYGVGMGTVFGTVAGAAKAAAPAGGLLAKLQTGASAVKAAGGVYGKVTGDTPENLMKAADYIQSDNALDLMTKVAKDELTDAGMEIQAENEAANAALRERLKKEQAELSGKMKQAAAEKAAQQGQPAPQPKKPPELMQIAALATPFILAMMR